MVLGLGSGTYLWRPLLTRPEGLPLLSDRAVCPSLAASAPPQVFPLSPSTIPSWSLACSLCGWPHLFQDGGQGSCVRSFCEEGWGTCGCPPLDISSLLCPQPSAPGGLFDKLGGGLAGHCTLLFACPGSGTLEPPPHGWEPTALPLVVVGETEQAGLEPVRLSPGSPGAGCMVLGPAWLGWVGQPSAGGGVC